MKTAESTSEQPDSEQMVAADHLDLLLHPERAESLRLRGDLAQLRIGYVPGVMPGKWFTRWHERFEHLCPLHEIPLAEASGIRSLTVKAALPVEAEGEDAEKSDDGVVQLPLTEMVLLRPEQEPISRDKERFHAITLYREKMVVVLPKEHVLTVYDNEVPLADLAEEFMLQDPAEVPRWAEISANYRAEHPQRLPEMRNTQEAIELVAAGLGLLLVPMSVARFYHRKDLTYKIVAGLEDSEVALVWKRALRDEGQEQLIQDFIGICRGRTAGSERGSDTKQTKDEKVAADKEREKQKRRAENAKRESRDRKARNARKNGNARQHSQQIKRASGTKRKKR